MNKCFSDSNCEHEPVGHGEMLHDPKGFDVPQGLVCILDRVFDRNSYSGRQGLDDFYGYEYVNVESSSISELHSFSRPADTEWKWILYQQQVLPSDLLTPFKSMDRYARNTVLDVDNNVKGDVKKAPAELSFASVLPAASKVGECHTQIRKPQRVHMIQALESNATVLSLKGSLPCHAVNSKDFTPITPQRGHVYAEVCEVLPLTASGMEFPARITLKDDPDTESYDLAPLMSSLTWGKDCVANACAGLQEGELVSLEGKITETMLLNIPEFPSPCEPLSGVMDPSAIPTFLEQSSVKDRSSYHPDDELASGKASNEKCFDAKEHDDEILGKALCHAQTRARLAEKLAAQALKDREKLAHLLLREAWTTFAYKLRAQTLELENRLLKSCSNADVLNGSKSMFPLEQRASNPWKLAQKHHPHLDKRNLRGSMSRQNKDGNSWRKRVVLSCTLGLAFVLGLSIAGAGLLIGWSMGWMLFS